MTARVGSARPKQNIFLEAAFELLHPPAGQLHYLDGLRSMAILLVISGHVSAQFAQAFGPTAYSRLPFVANGWIGVDLFFVLSGFFIGGQLWKELGSRGSIHIGQFILRRGFRIWPLYYFVFCCVTLGLILAGHPARQYGWTDLVFVTNYFNRGVVEGSWSLCTEEQFYIVTPLVLFWLAKYGRSVGSLRPLLWILLCTIPLLRAAIWVHSTGHFFQPNAAAFSPLYYFSITHCDGLVMGLILSNLWVSKQTRILKVANPWIWLGIATCMLASLYRFQKEIFDFSGLALFFGALLWLGLQRRIPVFNSRLFYWISRLSYGMYLNHEYFLPWLIHTVLPRVPVRVPVISNLLGVLIMTVVSMSIALVTFCLVEFPFLEIRKRLLTHSAKNSAAPAMTAVSR